MGFGIENGDFAPKYKRSEYFRSNLNLPEGVENFGVSALYELPSGHKILDIASTFDEETVVNLEAILKGEGKTLDGSHFPRVAVTQDGLMFALAGHPRLILTENGVFLNDEEFKSNGTVRRNFTPGNTHEERPMYFYEGTVKHGSLLTDPKGTNVKGIITVGVNLFTLNFNDIWGTIDAMDKAGAMSDSGIRTLVNPYFKLKLKVEGETL